MNSSSCCTCWDNGYEHGADRAEALEKALLRVAAFMNVTHSVERENPEPETIALWIEQAITSTVRSAEARADEAEEALEAERDPANTVGTMSWAKAAMAAEKARKGTE